LVVWLEDFIDVDCWDGDTGFTSAKVLSIPGGRHVDSERGFLLVGDKEAFSLPSDASASVTSLRCDVDGIPNKKIHTSSQN